MKCSIISFYQNESSPIILIFVFILAQVVVADLPQDLDGFLEVLFGTDECEEFLADASYLSVSTIECAPFKCDFPHQLCMRPASQYKDESSNQCRDLPQKCLTAANKGIPVPHSSINILRKPEIKSEISPTILPAVGHIEITTPPTFFMKPTGEVEVSERKYFGPICQQGVPEGRFCGFEQKFTYNVETGLCDQFWYPGCKTKNTNDNLFNTDQECRQATNHCGSNRRVEPVPTMPSGGSNIENRGNPEPIVSMIRNLGGGNVENGNNFGGSRGQLVNTFSQFLTGSALGNGDGNMRNRNIEGGGAARNIGEVGETQQPNFINLIANTIREVNANRNGDGGGNSQPASNLGTKASEWLNRFDAGQFANIFSSFG